MILSQFQMVGRELFSQGLVCSHSGNLSLRLGDNLIITRRGSRLGCLEENDLIETGVTKNRIREWHQKGLLKEIQVISVGRRFHRRFNKRTISLISQINKYQQEGFTLKAAAEKANTDAGSEEKKGKKEGMENG